MRKTMTLPPHLSLAVVDAALRAIELPVLPVVFGRRGADVVLEHPSVDGEHAVLELDGPRLMLRDLGSRSGTYLNGRRIGAAGVELRPEDRISIGAVDLTVRVRSNRPRRAGAAVVDPNNRTVPAREPAAPAEAHEPFMLIVTHHGHRRQYLLDRRVHVVGRSAEIRVADPALSRKHVQIELSGGEALIKDLASANGTYVAGERISVFRVTDEIVFEAGETVFHLTPTRRR